MIARCFVRREVLFQDGHHAALVCTTLGEAVPAVMTLLEEQPAPHRVEATVTLVRAQLSPRHHGRTPLKAALCWREVAVLRVLGSPAALEARRAAALAVRAANHAVVAFLREMLRHCRLCCGADVDATVVAAQAAFQAAVAAVAAAAGAGLASAGTAPKASREAARIDTGAEFLPAAPACVGTGHARRVQRRQCSSSSRAHVAASRA